MNNFLLFFIFICFIILYKILKKEDTNEYFTQKKFKTYVINLKERKDRRDKMDKILNKVGIDPIYIDAVNGSKLDTEDLIRKHIYSPDHRDLRKGEIGCYMSHVIAWKKIANGNDDYGLIIEDDIVINNDFYYKCCEYLEKIKDIKWDMFYVGRNCERHFGEKCNIGTFYTPDIFKSQNIGYGLYAYFIKKDFAKKLLSMAYPIIHPADHLIHLLSISGDANIYTTIEELAYVYDLADSDTMGIK